MARSAGIKYLSASDIMVISPRRGYSVIQQRHLYSVQISRMSMALPPSLCMASHGMMHEKRMTMLFVLNCVFIQILLSYVKT
jgi:hypothetical protein